MIEKDFLKIEEHTNRLSLDELKQDNEYIVTDKEIKKWIVDYEIQKQEKSAEHDDLCRQIFYMILIPSSIAFIAVLISLLTIFKEPIAYPIIVIMVLFLILLFSVPFQLFENFYQESFSWGISRHHRWNFYNVILSEYFDEPWFVSPKQKEIRYAEYLIVPESRRREYTKYFLKRGMLIREMFQGRTDNLREVYEKLKSKAIPEINANFVMFPYLGWKRLGDSTFSLTSGVYYELLDEFDNRIRVFEIHKKRYWKFWRKKITSIHEIDELYRCPLLGIYSVKLKLSEFPVTKGKIELIEAKILSSLTSTQKEKLKDFEKNHLKKKEVDTLGYGISEF